MHNYSPNSSFLSITVLHYIYVYISVCLYVCVYAWIYTYIYTSIHLSVYTRIHKWTKREHFVNILLCWRYRWAKRRPWPDNKRCEDKRSELWLSSLKEGVVVVLYYISYALPFNSFFCFVFGIYLSYFFFFLNSLLCFCFLFFFLRVLFLLDLLISSYLLLFYILICSKALLISDWYCDKLNPY